MNTTPPFTTYNQQNQFNQLNMQKIFINSPIRRLGKKNKLLQKLLPLFPKFEVFIEPFSGKGAVGLNEEEK